MSETRQIMAQELTAIVKDRDFFVTEFEKLKSPATTKLRKELRKMNARYFVVKNRIFRKVVQDVGLPLPDKWVGHTAVVASSDAVGLAKYLQSFKEQNEGFKFRFGYLNRKLIVDKEITYLSKLPSIEELRAKVVVCLNAPIANFAGVLRAQLTKVLYVLKAIQNSKS